MRARKPKPRTQLPNRPSCWRHTEPPAFPPSWVSSGLGPQDAPAPGLAQWLSPPPGGLCPPGATRGLQGRHSGQVPGEGRLLGPEARLWHRVWARVNQRSLPSISRTARGASASPPPLCEGGRGGKLEEVVTLLKALRHLVQVPSLKHRPAPLVWSIRLPGAPPQLPPWRLLGSGSPQC